MGVIRVMIVDDHPVVRFGLRALLESLPGYEIIAETAGGQEALREAKLGRPDVVLMDVRMGGIDGIEATRQIKAAVPETAVVMLTMHEDDDTVFAAMRAGAAGYVVKGASQEEIDRAIRAVAAGEAIFGPGVAQRVLGVLTAPRIGKPFPELTSREREVLDLVAAGKNNSAIAAELSLAPKTVTNHISTIFAKLQVADRSEAIVKARREGLGGQ